MSHYYVTYQSELMGDGRFTFVSVYEDEAKLKLLGSTIIKREQPEVKVSELQDAVSCVIKNSFFAN